jgi:4-methylaminobutanoate oxidase (formaldehyde-forming)
MEYSFGKQSWFEYSAAEHRAAREAVAIFDQTSFSKYVFQGKDTVKVLQRVCGNDVDVEPGKAVYTGLFNERGMFESDLTIIRDAEDRYYIVTATSQTTHDAAWIRRHTPDNADATLTDVTDEYSVLGVMGPRSRDLMLRVTDDDVSHDNFPFGTARTLRIGNASVRAVRITYVGELGWEMHIAMGDLPDVYEALRNAGQDLGVTNAGHYAINSLRLEKGYRAWGHDISPDDTPLDAGLSFAVAWDKPTPFLGREALLRQRDHGIRKRLVIFVLDDPDEMLWSNEPIFRDGTLVGYTTSGAYGHTVGGAIGMGYVHHNEPIQAGFIKSGSYTIEVTGRRVPATAFLRAPHDAKRERILC